MNVVHVCSPVIYAQCILGKVAPHCSFMQDAYWWKIDFININGGKKNFNIHEKVMNDCSCKSKEP